MTDVLVVGAGPTGLLLAGDLAAAGIGVKLLERRAEEANLTSAFALHARTLELLDLRGIADQLVAQGLQLPEVRVHLGPSHVAFNLRRPDSRFPDVLSIRQARTEALLEQRARQLGAPIVPGRRGDRAWPGPARCHADPHRRPHRASRLRGGPRRGGAAALRRWLVPGDHLGPLAPARAAAGADRP